MTLITHHQDQATEEIFDQVRPLCLPLLDDHSVPRWQRMCSAFVPAMNPPKE